MQPTDLVEDFCILIVEDSEMHQTLFESWLSGVSVRFATSKDGIDAQFDSTVAVACFSQSVLGEDEQDIRTRALRRNPYCKLVAFLDRSSFVTPYDDSYDACLRRPIDEGELQRTIERQLFRGAYHARLREFYTLNAKILQIRHSESDDSDPAVVKRRYEQLCEQLDEFRSRLSPEDIESISQSIKLQKRYLSEPSREDTEEGSSSASKYRPRRCPSCKFAWDTDHGNELGDGVVSIGAGVWKCTACGEVFHGLGDGDRRVTGL